MNLSLSGCGFLGIYHVGVASCFVEHAPELVKNCKVAGASAGALAGCLLVCDDIDLRECTEDVLEIVIRARSHALGPLHPSFNVTKILRDGFRKVLPKDAHKSASGRLFVSLTRLSDCSNVIVSEFETREDLIQVLLCSAFVPLYSGLIPPSYKGVRYVDGGLSNNSPCCSDADSTITVSPFSGESDICPPTDDTSNYLHMNLANTSIQLTPSNLYRLSRALFPPEPEIMTRMCRRGFQDALQFLKHRGLVSCNRHLSLRSLSEVHIHDDISLSGDDDDEDSLIEETQHCTDCQERKQEVDLIDNLPKPVLEAFQSASASVNDSRLAWIVSYATLPYVLPLETLYSFLSRFIDWLPYLPSDLQAFVYFLWHIAKHIVKHVESERHQYSARFSCQLAITESEIHQEGFEIFTEEELRNMRFNFNLGIQESQDGRQVRWQIGEDELRLCSDDSDENDNDLCNVQQHLTSVVDSSDVDT
ncbi:patatin-like phospholipase domain-containing protein 4 [Ptychodera flava]|uniref:patatin-like phospholipase domain-containing protein 4 n=1 Tax=Ptychodera flava TaxID=63121 RepID=UPI003969DB0C